MNKLSMREEPTASPFKTLLQPNKYSEIWITTPQQLTLVHVVLAVMCEQLYRFQQLNMTVH